MASTKLRNTPRRFNNKANSSKKRKSKNSINKNKSPKKKNSIPKSNRETRSQITCGICLQQKKNNPGLNFIKLKCGHKFHASCLFEYILNHNGKRCPLCRTNMLEDDYSDMSLVKGIHSKLTIPKGHLIKLYNSLSKSTLSSKRKANIVGSFGALSLFINISEDDVNNLIQKLKDGKSTSDIISKHYQKKATF